MLTRRPHRTLQCRIPHHRRSLRRYIPTNSPHRRNISRGILPTREYSATTVVCNGLEQNAFSRMQSQPTDTVQCIYREGDTLCHTHSNW